MSDRTDKNSMSLIDREKKNIESFKDLNERNLNL